MQGLRKFSSKLQFIVTATVLGNMLEWFDFALFGMMAPLFGELFFARDEWANIDLPFLFFALSAAARPIGGIVFGWLGDRTGRKTALVRTIVLMTLPILLIGVLPSYFEIGHMATLFLALFCLFQGFCIGGEFPGSIVFLTEMSPPKLRGYIGSWAYFGVLFGMSFAALDIYVLTSSLSKGDFQAWGWRLPFFFGAMLGIIGIFLRRMLHETPAFQEARNVGQLVQKPITAAVRQHSRQLLRGIGLLFADAVGFNLVIVFCSSYFLHTLKLSTQQSFLLSAYTVTVGLAVMPFAGKLSSWVGPSRLVRWALALLCISSIPLYLLMHTVLGVFVAQGLLVALLALYLCNLPALFHDLFPTEVRYSCTGLVINVSVALFGGTTPILVNYLLEKTQWPLLPGVYLAGAAAVSFFCARKIS